MRIGRALAAAAGSLAIVGLPLATASAAPATPTGPATPPNAEHVVYAVPVSSAQVEPLKASTACRGNNHGAYACFHSYGDKFYLYDTKADGKSIGVKWQTNYGRHDYCVDTYGAGVTVVCNWNMREGKKVTFWTANYGAYTGKWTNWSWSKTATI